MIKLLYSVLVLFIFGSYETSAVSLKEYDKELYSLEKQDYDPEFFRERTLDFMENYVKENNKNPGNTLENGQEFYSIYGLDKTPIEYEKYSTDENENENELEKEILYLTKSNLINSQVFYVQGTLYNSEGKPYDSTTIFDASKGEGDIIVRDILGNLFIHPSVSGVIDYPSFLSTQHLSFPAICYVEEGKIKNLATDKFFYPPVDREEEEEKFQGRPGPILPFDPLKESLYGKIKKNGQSYYTYNHDSTFLIDKDLGIACDLKHTPENTRYDEEKYSSFRTFDLYKGFLLKKTELPKGYAGRKISKSQDKFFVLLEKRGEENKG
jgi:hypothetical protein